MTHTPSTHDRTADTIAPTPVPVAANASTPGPGSLRARDVGKVFVNYFENLVAQALGYPSQQCITAEFCGKGLALEHNGDVFSCDHYVYPDYRLGNIGDMHWATMAYSERQKAFAFAKRDTLPTVCRECRHLKLCWGECPKNRFVRSTDGEAGLNYLCHGLQMYYDHALRSMPDVMRRIGKTPSRAGRS